MEIHKQEKDTRNKLDFEEEAELFTGDVPEEEEEEEESESEEEILEDDSDNED